MINDSLDIGSAALTEYYHRDSKRRIIIREVSVTASQRVVCLCLAQLAYSGTHPTSNAAAEPESERDPLRNPCPASRLAVRTALGWSLSMFGKISDKVIDENGSRYGDMERIP